MKTVEHLSRIEEAVDAAERRFEEQRAWLDNLPRQECEELARNLQTQLRQLRVARESLAEMHRSTFAANVLGDLERL